VYGAARSVDGDVYSVGPDSERTRGFHGISKWVQKLLEHVNVKIGSVLTDVFGVSGLHMLLALLDGRAAPEEIAGLARGSAKRKTPQLKKTFERDQAKRFPGMFANQNIVCQLRDTATADFLRKEFGVTTS
jgi:hypothetical protein